MAWVTPVIGNDPVDRRNRNGTVHDERVMPDRSQLNQLLECLTIMTLDAF